MYNTIHVKIYRAILSGEKLPTRKRKISTRVVLVLWIYLPISKLSIPILLPLNKYIKVL